MSMNNRRAAAIAREPFIAISATRGLADGATIFFADTDWSGEALTCEVALRPGLAAVATLPVTIATETDPWQHLVDCDGVPKEFVPCDTAMTDETTITKMTVSWSEASFGSVPAPTVLGEPIELFYEVRRSDGSGPRFLAGEFVLTEKVL